MTSLSLVQVQHRFGRSVFRRALAEHGLQSVESPAGVGMFSPRIRKRGGSQSPSPMSHETRKSVYLAQSRSGRVTSRQSRRLIHKRNHALRHSIDLDAGSAR